MEVQGGKKRILLVCLYEMMGTALFVYCVLASNGNAYSVIIGLFSSIIIFGGVTGGHFNPAVTMGVFLACGHYMSNLVFMLLITCSQFAGAAAGLALAWLALMNPQGKVDKENIGIVAPIDPATGVAETGDSGYNYNIQDAWTQTALTFVFVAVILTIKDVRDQGCEPGSQNGILQALGVVLTLYGCIQAALAHTGPGFNPAVASA